jgi:hypothetical protein
VSLEKPRGRFFAWLNRHPSEREALQDVPPEVLGKLWADAWAEGGTFTLAATNGWGSVVIRLEEIAAEARSLVRVLQDAELDRETERPSFYWARGPEQHELEELPF